MIGSTVAHYSILEKLGEGGMGVVYKALDTKLDRPVALKFLPAGLHPSDQDRARFLQEARAAAALNHPNVCSVLDIAEHDGRMFIVMEYVDGQTLRAKLPSLGLKQALDIGIQIAEGLAAAHEKGIVHRDIKPENIMVRKDGIAQIMDFGLAKLRGTLSGLTRAGSTVGTAGYMSPEQVQGQDVDHRSDIFSLGLLMYELLTGRTPFKAAHETALAYEIVNVNPEPMTAVKPGLDPELDRIVLGCLEKDPNERTQSAKQVSIDLNRFRRESGRQQASRVTAARPAAPHPAGTVAAVPGSGSAAPGDLSPTASSGVSSSLRSRLPWVISAVLFVALAAAGILGFTRDGAPAVSFAASLLPQAGSEYILQDGGHMAVSPDGTMLAYVARDSSGKTTLWVRDLARLTPRQLAETEGAEYPFWSPDSRFIAYFVPGKMKKILATGGPPFTICDAPSGRGGTWNAEDIIAFAPSFDRAGISRVNAAGGTATVLVGVDSTRNMANARWPHFLPDGKHFLYTTQAAKRSSEFSGALYVGSLDGTVDKHLLDLSTNCEYRDGLLLYVRQEALVAQPFDAGALEFSGEALPVVDKIGYAPNRSRGVFSTSVTGVLVYHSVFGQGRVLAWIDRAANELVPVGSGTIDNNAFLSLDDSKIVFDDYEPVGKNFDIWSYDIVRGVRSRLTFEASDDSDPVLSPDGSRIVFTSWKEGVNLYLSSTSGTQQPSLLMKSLSSALPTDWSVNGRYILYQDVEKTASFDLWYLTIDSVVTASVFLKTPFAEELARFSPDGRWVAYISNESGRPEIYVKPFPAGEGKWQVSTAGGYRPIWARDGKSVYYETEEGIVRTAVEGSGAALTIGATAKIFRNPPGATLRLHAVTRNASRILVSHLPAGRGVLPLTLVTNWRQQLQTR